ncbi:MAG: hypothetical protein KDD67_12745 [Ignavibacteriae bacterium]|nr:hypothetical protein [Ignavibacteriota bacterium]MCB9214343.1 hypothetical protein [Ignavibacteria bacterium]
MENGRVVELLSEMLVEMKGVNQRLDRVDNRLEGLDHRLEGLDHRFEGLEHRVERLEGQQAKTNLALAEMRTSFMRLADRLIHQDQILERLTKIEAVVFK